MNRMKNAAMPHDGLHREPDLLLRPGVRPVPRRVLLALGLVMTGFGIILFSAASVLVA